MPIVVTCLNFSPLVWGRNVSHKITNSLKEGILSPLFTVVSPEHTSDGQITGAQKFFKTDVASALDLVTIKKLLCTRNYDKGLGSSETSMVITLKVVVCYNLMRQLSKKL